jgi:hypothetical protein
MSEEDFGFNCVLVFSELVLMSGCKVGICNYTQVPHHGIPSTA